MEKVQFVNCKWQMVMKGSHQVTVWAMCKQQFCDLVASSYVCRKYKKFLYIQSKGAWLIIVNPNHLCNLLVRTHITPLVVVVHKQAICLYN